jgi:CubicO group peptidase (beta-lactamase class C family)
MIISRKRMLAGATLVVIGGLLALTILPTAQKLYRVVHFFDADNIVENFRSADLLGDISVMTASSKPRPYPSDAAIELPEGFSFDGQTRNTEAFLTDSWTTGLLVIQDDRIVYERYSLGHSESTRTISWSMAKSFVSAMIGIAVHEGSIANLEQPVDFYAPELKGSGYESVPIKDVLQMSSGIAFNEDYGDFNSDINRWGRGFALGSPQDEFAASLTRGREPGTLNHYVSIDTHVLSMVLRRATGKSISDYMQEKLYQPLGMEYNGYWLVDGAGKEMALGGLNLTMRDFAKLGSLYLNRGALDGRQIVPANWIAASTVADAPHLQPAEGDFGYGYQWWLPLSDDGEYMAMGVYGQYIYINPAKNMVVVKLSANPRYNDISYVPSSDFSHLAFFRSIDSRGAD